MRYQKVLYGCFKSVTWQQLDQMDRFLNPIENQVYLGSSLPTRTRDLYSFTLPNAASVAYPALAVGATE